MPLIAAVAFLVVAIGGTGVHTGRGRRVQVVVLAGRSEQAQGQKLESNIFFH